MSHEYEATIAGAFLDFMEKGYVYRGLQARVLVHLRQHRARGSGSGVRRSHQPIDLGELQSGRAAAAGAAEKIGADDPR